MTDDCIISIDDIQVTTMSALPVEVLCHILSFCSQHDQFECRGLSSQFWKAYQVSPTYPLKMFLFKLLSGSISLKASLNRLQSMCFTSTLDEAEKVVLAIHKTISSETFISLSSCCTYHTSKLLGKFAIRWTLWQELCDPARTQPTIHDGACLENLRHRLPYSEMNSVRFLLKHLSPRAFQWVVSDSHQSLSLDVIEAALSSWNLSAAQYFLSHRRFIWSFYERERIQFPHLGSRLFKS